jgi:16S rRNA (cytidine1402-2'-O)-methyltransferase
LKEVDILYAEDTRVSGQLLKTLGIDKPIHRYDEFVEHKLIPRIIECLTLGDKVGLISDAGTPTISDPGYKLVRECIRFGIKVVNIPGPSAVTCALSVSGLPTDHFMFFGFLPKSENHIRKIFQKMKSIHEVQPTTFIFFESPYRLLKSIEFMQNEIGEVDLAVAHELTKYHEEILRGKASKVHDELKLRAPLKGEFTVCLHFPL